MKKKIALLLVLVFLTTVLLPAQALAAYDKELQKAITTAKSLFNISEGYDSFTYNISKHDEKTVFELMWNDTRNKLGSINVSVDSGGKITNYYSYKPYDDRNQRKLPAVSKSDARTTADNFIRKVNPSAWNTVKFQENYTPINIYDRSYYFRYIRIQNGVPFPENGINVSIDAMTGNVQSYNFNWYDDLKFPDTAGVMEMEKAKDVFKDKLGLKLVYRLNYGPDAKPYLVYTNVYNNRYIDAKTGEVVTSDYYYGYDSYGYGYKERMGFEGGAGVNGGSDLTPEEKEAVKQAADIIDQQKAEDLARKVLKVDSTFKLNYISLYNNWQSKGDFIWSLDFGKETKVNGISQYFNISATLDARTGDILNFYRSQPYNENSRGKYSEKQLQTAAEEFIKTMQPARVNDIELTTWEQPWMRPLAAESDQPMDYYFTFTRKVNGAYFAGNGFNIAVSNVTGEVTSYNFNWYKKEFPATDKVISLDEAYKVFYDTIGIQLQYVSYVPPQTDSRIIPPFERIKPDVKLVYAVKPGKPVNIDAKSGVILDYEGKPFRSGDIAVYNDIKGHYAEKQIKVLTEYGISLPGGQFKPNQAATQREFLYLLNKSINPYMALELPDSDKEDDELYNALTAVGIIKEGERAPKSLVTRQDAVKFVVRALRYDKVAEIDKGIYKLPFKDAGKVKSDLLGYMAIGYGLNIFNGNEGYCNPTANLSRAQAVILLYNYMNVS